MSFKPQTKQQQGTIVASKDITRKLLQLRHYTVVNSTINKTFLSTEDNYQLSFTHVDPSRPAQQFNINIACKTTGK